MAENAAVRAAEEPRVPVGYGRLVCVTPLGEKEVILWFEDSVGTVRALRMGVDPSGLELRGQAQIART